MLIPIQSDSLTLIHHRLFTSSSSPLNLLSAPLRPHHHRSSRSAIALQLSFSNPFPPLSCCSNYLLTCSSSELIPSPASPSPLFVSPNLSDLVISTFIWSNILNLVISEVLLTVSCFFVLSYF